jgi:phosphoserine/homoserine phosphotransferase
VQIVCLDLEGVLVPEIWIELSQRTGISELSKTTRDEPDYGKLMDGRLEILNRHNLSLSDIQAVIDDMGPLPGAKEFIDHLRPHFQVIILSDTFYEFAAPLMRQLGWPTLFCHRISADAKGCVTGYHLRMPDHKRAAVNTFKRLNFKTIAAGDSFNDIAMLQEAHAGIFFCPPAVIAAAFPQFPVTQNYDELLATIIEASAAI